MDALKGCDYPEFCKPPYVGGVHMLRMFDSPSQSIALNLDRGKGLLIQAQNLAIGPVTNGMGVQLITVLQRKPCGLLDLLNRFKHQTGGAGEVRIGRQQPRTMCSQCTVNLFLD